MATTDYTDVSSPCPCGQGTITVTQASPDHPWVKASQITYSAEIDCEVCRQVYSVQHDYGAFPHLVRKADLQAFQAARQKRQTAEREIEASREAGDLRRRIAARVDAEWSMAAKHRQLQGLGLAYESLGTYRKRPYSGADAAKRAGGTSLARIGCIDELGAGDLDFFREAKEKLEHLEAEERRLKPQPVKTGARWLQK